MSIANPLSTGTELTRSFAARQSVSLAPPGTSTTPKQSVADPFASDLLTLSKQARTRQQSEAQLEARVESAELPSESVQVSASTGQSRARGNLTQQSAIRLYQAVASLL